jgi:hypothetical protein
LQPISLSSDGLAQGSRHGISFRIRKERVFLCIRLRPALPNIS